VGLVPLTTINGPEFEKGTPVIVTPVARALFGSGARALPVGLEMKSVTTKFIETVTLDFSKLLIFRL
jgi:hypothetical protein